MGIENSKDMHEDRDLLAKLNDFFAAEILPKIRLDGGDAEIVELKDFILYIQFKGACIGCPFSFYTLLLGIQAKVKEQFPFIQKVVTL